MNKLSIRDLEMAGKRVFMRVDFNVPLDGARVTDDTRIRETLPTIEFARKRGARLVLASHLGRPKGKHDPKYSLKPVAAKLAELLGLPVDFAADCVGPDAEAKSRAVANGGVLLLENVRYHPEEEANDENFSRQLAALCDGLFVCDAFGSAHRAHPPVVGTPGFGKNTRAGLRGANHGVRQAGRSGLADGARTRLSRQGALQSRAPLRRGARRRESF